MVPVSILQLEKVKVGEVLGEELIDGETIISIKKRMGRVRREGRTLSDPKFGLCVGPTCRGMVQKASRMFLALNLLGSSTWVSI